MWSLQSSQTQVNFLSLSFYIIFFLCFETLFIWLQPLASGMVLLAPIFITHYRQNVGSKWYLHHYSTATCV